MDPITGIGLAASIIQLVQFGINAAKACHEIYQHGSTIEHTNADNTADHLTRLIKSVQQSLANTGTQPAVFTKDEKDLLDLGHKSEDCAKRLQDELHKLQAPPHASPLKAARKAARSIWKKNTIVKIQEQLEGYRRLLETSLLYRLSQRFDAQGLSATENFAKLDQNLKHIISSLASSQTSLDTLIKQESDQTRLHINSLVADVKKLHIDDSLYRDIINSLHYPEICSRQEQVASEFDGIENTYEWIFDEPSTMESELDNRSKKPRGKSQWANFPEWLRSGSKVYWISGKAGSGKSTLMNYICDHKRKEELLKQWSTERRLLTPTFFFWNAGVRQQKTIDGLLRSLIYQILTECRQLIACFKSEPLYAWTEKRLLNALYTLLTQTQVPVAICLFIDGLDEFDGRYSAIIETIRSLSSQSHIKVCLSSRPLPDFEKAFAGMPSLRLQDLTFDSILAYAEYQLLNLIEERILNSKLEEERTRELLYKIVGQAQGVFLWAVIAIRDVRDGLQDMADLNELELMIEGLPAGVENLYTQILHRLKPVYRREAMRFLQIILYESELHEPWKNYLDLYRLYFINLQRVSEDLPLVCSGVGMSALVGACHALKIRLLSHTLGLLDLRPIKEVVDLWDMVPDFKKITFESEDDLIPFTKVRFHHRTVKEFLLHNIEAKTSLATAGLKEEHLRICIARGTFAHLEHLAQVRGRTFELNPRLSFVAALRSALTQVVIVERLVGAAQTKFMRSLHNYSFMWKSLVEAVEGSSFDTLNPIPYRICGSYGPSVDLIALAAGSGMWRYVCEVLGFPTLELRRYPPSLLDFRHLFSTENVIVAGLSWVTSTQCDLHPSGYRRRLNECLEWKTYTQEADLIKAEVDSNMLTETYLLASLRPFENDLNLAEKLSLIEILVHAGANPVVQVEPAKGDVGVFWHNWLNFLVRLRGYNYFKPRGDLDWVDKRVTLDDIFNTTKALLAQGADIEVDQLLGLTSSSGEFDLHVTVSPMFLLEEIFSGYPEFCHFAAAIKPKMRRPLRGISIIHKTNHTANHVEPENQAKLYPDDEESEMLWPLIADWQETNRIDDRDALWSATARVWRAHYPDIRLKEDSDEGPDVYSDKD